MTDPTVPIAASPFRHVASAANKILSLNRVGRGTAAFFLLLSICVLGTDLGIGYQLVLAHTATLWYNGLNDICDYQVDLKAYGKGAPKKVLLNGSFTIPELWTWMSVLLVASVVILVWKASASAPAVVFFLLGIASSVIYNVRSKYLVAPSFLKFLVLDVLVACPFAFFYLSLIFFTDARPDGWVMVLTQGVILLGGLYGNLIYASKDLSTDSGVATSLPMLLGARSVERRVIQSRASRLYLWTLYTLWAALFGAAAYRGYYLVSVPLALWLLYRTVLISRDRATEPSMRRVFILLSNWLNVLTIYFYLDVLGLVSLSLVVGLGVVHVGLSAAYFYDMSKRGSLTLRFRSSSGRRRWEEPAV
jgi:hypothetical protein